MPNCENCGKALASSKYCPGCGTPTLLGRRALIEETRFKSLGDAITESYADQPPSWWRNALQGRSTRTIVASALMLAIVAAAAWTLARVPRAAPLHAPSAVHHRRIAQVRPSSAPSATQAATPSPTIAPTATPSPAPRRTAMQKRTPHVLPPAPIPIAEAPSIVRSNRVLAVGRIGSCAGGNVTIRVRGYPRGCTLFGESSSGALANRRGTALVVPVSTSEDVGDVAYGLLYVRRAGASTPQFLGILSGDGTGHLVLRVRRGRIVERNGTRTRYVNVS